MDPTGELCLSVPLSTHGFSTVGNEGVWIKADYKNKNKKDKNKNTYYILSNIQTSDNGNIKKHIDVTQIKTTQKSIQDNTMQVPRMARLTSWKYVMRK